MIVKEDLGEENPKVYVSCNQEEWQVECSILSEFLLVMTHLQTVFTLPYIYEGFKFITSEDLNAVETHFPERPPAIRHWSQGAEFYDGTIDGIVVLGGGKQLVYTSSPESFFEAMDNFLKGTGEET